MCGCESTFVCTRCAGTTDDWRTWTDEPKTPAEERDERLSVYTDQVVLPGLRVNG